RASGEKLWSVDFETGFLSSPVVAGDRLVIGDVDGWVYCLEVKTGKEIWRKETGGEISGSAGLFGDRVLVASQDGKLYCFELSDGKDVWTYQADDQIRCAPTVAGNRTFLGGCDAQLHIVNLETGESDGEKLPLDGPTGSTPAIRGDLAIVPSMDGVVFGFDWKAKKEIWRYEDLEQSQEYRSSAAVSDGVAVISSQRKHVDAIDTETGKRIWRKTLRRRADASPVIAGEDVWIPATDGRLLRLGLKDGEELWSYEIRGGFIGAVAVAGGQLFVADDEGVVRCFGEK
ncbi:MAG: PQQ-binding-like beta-propeller repeat protein, partial [Planctomycetota bacterium]